MASQSTQLDTRPRADQSREEIGSALPRVKWINRSASLAPELRQIALPGLQGGHAGTPDYQSWSAPPE
jgi:hypothetical protein